MKNLAGKTPAKVIAFLLAVVCAVGCVNSLYFSIRIAMEGGYRLAPEGYFIQTVEATVESDMDAAETYYALLLNGCPWTEELAEFYEVAYGPDASNFRYTVEDYDTGEVLLTNASEEEDYQFTWATDSWVRPADFEVYYDYENYLQEHYYNLWQEVEERVLAMTEEPLTLADGTEILVEGVASDYRSVYAAAIPEELEPEDDSARHVVITGHLLQNLSGVDDDYSRAYRTAMWSYRFRMAALWTAIGCGVCFGALALFLMYGAGRRSSTKEIVLRRFDQVSWDLLLVVCAGLGWLLVMAGLSVYDWVRFYNDLEQSYPYVAGLLGLEAVLAALALGFAVSIAARAKTPGWLKNALCYRAAAWLGRLLNRPMRQLRELVRSLPMLWKAVLFGLAAVAVEFVCVQMLYYNGFGMPLVAWNVAMGVLGLLAALSMRKLQVACGRIADGELDYRLDTGTMQGDFRRHGEDLNRIGSGLSRAVEERLRSERLKTELITNVSHDLKTPLTSIVNYADLLGKVEGLPPEAIQYVEVLQRQSARLKKLTEDLVEASKASTGNLPVTITDVNLCELLLQVEGEYEERFLAAGLTPVLRLPEQPILARGDGRYLWRILDNLMNNVGKYALAGTRVYVQAGEQDGGVVFSVKNISRDQLTISAEGLAERFVRGDSSRNTEGSGLGLSIAISLAQLMGGRLTLTVDGDLFKAEVWLRKARPAPETDPEQ